MSYQAGTRLHSRKTQASKKVFVRGGIGNTNITHLQHMKTKDGSKRLAEFVEAKKRQIQGLNMEERDILQQMEVQNQAANVQEQEDSQMTDTGAFEGVPFGDEGIYASHAGGEAELFPEIQNEFHHVIE